MNKPGKEITSIVLVGSLNTAIFQPVWFEKAGLIRPMEGQNAQNLVLIPDITTFELEWVTIQVVRNKFLVRSREKGHEEELRDLVLGTFKILSHTPLCMLGINSEVHYQVADEKEWHEIGHKLAPKDIWNNVLKEPGMRKLTIQGIRTDGLDGYIYINVEPSTIREMNPGIFISINNHFEIGDKDKNADAKEIVTILEKNWTQVINYNRNTIDYLMETL
ncbi:MAG: hypothetical protein JXB88_21750 [Spirochaetales bacterium]|nr:hypothetical protein [Spirochaetales bacterium]